MINNCKIEICCGSIDDVIAASKFPIDRIELNSALELGGLTCSLNTLLEAKKVTDVPICCMVRNRGAGFNYSDAMFEVMLKDSKTLLENGADGIVFGFLKEDNSIDIEKTKKMVELAKQYGKETVFHKAFDETDDLMASAKILADLGITRVLTSAGTVYPHILDGVPMLKQLHDTYGDQLQILPGGGVRTTNVQQLLKETGIHQVHMTSKRNYHDLSDYVGFDDDQFKEMIEKISEL